MNRFLLGALAAVALTIALFFLSFWRESRDRLFAFFAAAFAVLGIEWALHGALSLRQESQHFPFLLRLCAFVLILIGIIDKNRSR
jgi:hypothetical protein